MSFGSSPFGTSPFGTSGLTGVTFELLTAVPLISTSVDLTFSDDVDFSIPAALDSLSYTFDNGLVCVGVAQTGLNTVRLYTTAQSFGVLYEVTVSLLVKSTSGAILGDNTALFTGLESTVTYSVSDLDARTHCQGRRISLSWTNPTPVPAWTRIVRRQKNWVFDLTDDHTVVYDGPGLNGSFEDTGVATPEVVVTVDVAAGDTTVNVSSSTGIVLGDLVRIETLIGPINYEIVEVTGVGVGTVSVTALANSYTVANGAQLSKSEELLDTTYYYYSVLTSTFANPPDEDFQLLDTNHAAGLSIPPLDSSETFFWNNTPDYMRERDADVGNGYLGQWYEIMGCWLNIMRGQATALRLIGDDDSAPYNSLSAKNFSLGIDPEGYSYDYEIPRRSIVSLINVYKRRGTCEGLIRATRMFTKWDATCSEFSLASCASGTRSFALWDGTSTLDQNEDAGIVLANRTLTDATKTWAADEWLNGTLTGSIGDVACVSNNTSSTELALIEPDRPHSIDGTVLVGATTVPLTGTTGLAPGITLQLEQAASFTTAEIVEVATVSVGSITVKEPLVNGYIAGDFVSIGKSLIRAEFLGSGGTWATVSGTIRELTYAPGGWVQTQWVGYKILASDNTLHDVISSEGGTLRVDAVALPADGAFAVAKDFVLGGSFAARAAVPSYRVYNGTHSFLFEPASDFQTRGTVYDNYSRLWMGSGSTLLGAWGSSDVGIFITTPVTLHLGKAVSTVGAVLSLDPTQPAPAVNEWAGFWLNPNQNQSQLFQIVSNTATTVTVGTSIEAIGVVGQAYYVLNPRDASRYRQLVSRFSEPNREFANMDIDVRVLFA